MTLSPLFVFVPGTVNPKISLSCLYTSGGILDPWAPSITTHRPIRYCCRGDPEREMPTFPPSRMKENFCRGPRAIDSPSDALRHVAVTFLPLSRPSPKGASQGVCYEPLLARSSFGRRCRRGRESKSLSGPSNPQCPLLAVDISLSLSIPG
ncbi:hypothetical protein LX36DRAFT_664994 [Colletotrichum falcatum]|nr:hypothetical protein LX36DRAFT_664994 [Colletotrichum falcatum]